MRYTPRREATEPRSGECLQWGLFGHVDFPFFVLPFEIYLIPDIDQYPYYLIWASSISLVVLLISILVGFFSKKYGDLLFAFYKSIMRPVFIFFFSAMVYGMFFAYGADPPLMQINWNMGVLHVIFGLYYIISSALAIYTTKKVFPICNYRVYLSGCV